MVIKMGDVHRLMKIAFVVDGGLEMGMGHVQQSTTLAKELTNIASIVFFTKSGEIVINQIRAAGFNVINPKNDDEMINLLREMNPNIVIIDKLDVAEQFAKEIKESLNSKLVIFTNLTSANKFADIAVTADIGSQFQNIKFIDKKTNTLYYYGPKYWILRQEFYEFKKKEKCFADKVEKILLIFGGSDPSNLTSAVLSELLSLNYDFKIDIIVGAQYIYLDTVNQVLMQHPNKKSHINLYNNVKNVAELMYSADLVIASPGLSAFEALCVGTPVIVMPQDMLQKETYEGFMRILDKTEVHKLSNMIASKNFTYPNEENILTMQIGEGKSELIEIILEGAE